MAGLVTIMATKAEFLITKDEILVALARLLRKEELHYRPLRHPVL